MISRLKDITVVCWIFWCILTAGELMMGGRIYNQLAPESSTRALILDTFAQLALITIAVPGILTLCLAVGFATRRRSA